MHQRVKADPGKGGCCGDGNVTRKRKSLEWMEGFGIEFNCDLMPSFKVPCSKVQKDLQVYTLRLTEGELDRMMNSFLPLLSELDILEKWAVSDSDLKSSLLRILLNCDAFQGSVIMQLGQFLEMTEFESELSRIRKVTVHILRNLMYLYHINDMESLTSVLLNAVEKCHESLKELILQNLFQIIPCEGHVVDRLMEMMSENVSLTPYVLMALDGVKGTDTDQNGIRKYVLDNILQAASTKDLPVVVKFLVSTTDDGNAASTVDSLRTQLKIRDGRFRADSLSIDDAYIFLITQFRHALQVNNSFLKCYVSAIESTKADLEVLDIWIIFCMFSVTSLRSKSQQLITKIACKSLTINGICEAITGHERAITELKGALVDLMSWCLSSSDKNVIEIGIAIASSTIIEFTDTISLSDIVSTLVTAIGLGSERTADKVADLLERLSYEVPEKIAPQCSLLEGVLWSSGELPAGLFGKVARVCTRLIYNNAQSLSMEGSHLSIGFTKMIHSLKSSTKRNGVVGMATLINRYDDICKCDSSQATDLFAHVFSLIGDDVNSALLLFKCIFNNRHRSNMFNDYLIGKLSKLFGDIVERKTGSEPIEFELDEEDKYLNILAFFDPDQTDTFRARRHKERLRSAVVLFTSVGLALLLDSHRAKGDDLKTVCADIYPLGVAVDFNELSDEHTVTVLMFAHSFIMMLLNFFSDQVDDSTFVRYSHLLAIEDHLVAALHGIDKYVHPVFGDIFPKHMAFLKRKKQIEDSSCFMSKYRSSFIPASESMFNILFEIPIPVADDDLRTVLRLLIDYKHNMNTNLSDDGLFPAAQFVSLRVLGFLANCLLPSIVDDDRHLAVDIAYNIFDIFKMHVSHPTFKDKNSFSDLMTTLARACDSRSSCFLYYSKMMTSHLDQRVKLALLVFLRELLHSGPTEKIDVDGRECKLLCKMAKELLSCDAPLLDKSEVKIVLPIFLDHDPRALDDVGNFVTSVFTLDILAGNECDDWPSLVPETFSLFFNQSFLVLNRKLSEIKRRISSNAFVITEEAVATIMNRLNKVTVIMKGLLLHTCTLAIPIDVLRSVLRQGVSWVDCLVSLFPFLEDAKQCEFHMVQEFLELSRCIVRQLQVIVDHVRRNEPALQSLIPNISKSLASWTYAVKSTMGRKCGEGLTIATCKERTLLGELILTQALSASSST